jgi:hypothetical protein
MTSLRTLIADQLETLQTQQLELPTGDTVTVSYKYGDSLDSLVRTVVSDHQLPTDHSWAIHFPLQFDLAPVTNISQLAQNAIPDTPYILIGCLRQRSNTVDYINVDVKFKSGTESVLMRNDFSVKYYQKYIYSNRFSGNSELQYEDKNADWSSGNSTDQVWFDENLVYIPELSLIGQLLSVYHVFLTSENADIVRTDGTVSV